MRGGIFTEPHTTTSAAVLTRTTLDRLFPWRAFREAALVISVRGDLFRGASAPCG